MAWGPWTTAPVSDFPKPAVSSLEDQLLEKINKALFLPKVIPQGQRLSRSHLSPTELNSEGQLEVCGIILAARRPAETCRGRGLFS